MAATDAPLGPIGDDERSEEENQRPSEGTAVASAVKHKEIPDDPDATQLERLVKHIVIDEMRSREQEVNTEVAMTITQRIREKFKGRTEKIHHFWNTQPIPKYGDAIETTINTFIEENVDPETVRKEPYSLHEEFMWADTDLDNPIHLQDLYTLLTENYVEDDQCKFRFDYSKEFLMWSLCVPGIVPNLLCGVRAKKTRRLVAFISCVPQRIRVYDKIIRMGEINFLCVHKRMRNKKVAPVLIREITRRANLLGLNQAAYTAGIVLPRPIAFCQYHHRSLNPKKLVACGFSTLSSKEMTMARAVKLYRVPTSPKLKGIRQIEEKDLAQVYKLLTTYLRKFAICPVYSTEEEFMHIFMSRENVIYSYVVETNGIVTDFISFYCLQSTVVDHPTYKSIKGAYMFYHAATVTPLKDLVADCLVFANNAGFDVFNALDCMDNEDFFDDLKFGNGTGRLQYYLYNWKCPPMNPEQIGLILQ